MCSTPMHVCLALQDNEAPASDPEQAPKLKARRAVVLSDDESN